MSDRHIELGLGRPEQAAAAADRDEFARLSDNLLGMLADRAVDSCTLDTNGFRRKVADYRSRMSAEGERLAELVDEVITACREFAKRAAGFEREREEEIGALVETLTQAIAKLAGEAVSVNAELTKHANRFGRLTEVEDIRELKRRITTEVDALDRFVTEKQERDEAYYSTLNRRIDVLQSRLVETEQAAALDPLTEIPNRGTFDRTIRRWLEVGSPFVIALLDIDNFKRVNDTYGHPVGDRVLLAAARSLSQRVRASDFVARYGGEEFAVLLAGTSLRRADARARELLAAIAGSVYDFEHDGQPCHLRYTMSCGLAEASPGDTAESVIRRADEGLYEAKHAGKNCVVARKASLLRRVLGGTGD